MGISELLFERAQKIIPGGVNSPVRAFGAVGGAPRFIVSANGAIITDADGMSYIDYVGSWGPMILGHSNPVIREAVIKAASDGLSFGAATENEVKMAELVSSFFPSMEMVRMTNSGTEAVMSAIRLARGYTGRDKIVKFEGCYHGHCDSMLVSAGSGLMTRGVASSLGVTDGVARDTLTAAFNDTEAVRLLFEQNPGEIAAVIIEPVAANMGVVPPREDFLESLRRLTTENGALLIFDEVITGFRLGMGGAQEYYGVQPDITTLGKIIGGGLPVGAYGGRRDIMELVSPCGDVYQAGTLSGNPVSMAAGLAQLGYLQSHPEIYANLNSLGDMLFSGLEKIVHDYGAPCILNRILSLGSLFFCSEPVTDYKSAKRSDTAAFSAYFNHMLKSGFYLAPSQFEALFLSNAHTESNIGKTLEAAQTFFKNTDFEVTK